MPKVVSLGGGHGLAAVVRSLRGESVELVVVVTIADDGGSSGELRRQRADGPAFGDLRRSLIASSADDRALARAFDRAIRIRPIGRHPIGNLVLSSVSNAFGDLEKSSAWLGEQLGAHARVLPASAEPVSLVADLMDGTHIHGESTIGAVPRQIERLRFLPDQPAVPAAVTTAIAEADYVLISPGSLFTSVIAAAGLPGIRDATASSRGTVFWIANLVRDRSETASMSGGQHLGALCTHGVRVDGVLFDPDAEVSFTAADFSTHGITPIPRRVRSEHVGQHDAALLKGALRELLALPDPLPAVSPF
jgi:uncharacterized cofD-like protein